MTQKEQYDYYMRTGFTPVVGTSIGNKFAQNGTFTTKDFFEPVKINLVDIETGLNIKENPKAIKTKDSNKTKNINKKRKTKQNINKK